MPIPKPKQGEQQSDFMSRCMSNDIMRKEYGPDQRAAICYTSWRNKKMNLRFNYNVPITEKTEDSGDFIIQGTAINATTTANNHKFLEEELKSSANTLTGVPLLVDHRNEVDAIKGRVLIGEYAETNKKVNFKAKVVDKLAQEMIKDGRINSVSVGAAVTDMDIDENDNNIMIPRGIQFKELSLVAVPADEGATFGLALAEAYNTKENTYTEEKQVSDMEAERKRRGMSVGQFYAIPRDPPSASKLPIFDAAHTRNAMARFNQIKSVSADEKRKAKAKIMRAAKKFGIDTSGFEEATAKIENLEVKMTEEIVDNTEVVETPEAVTVEQFNQLKEAVEGIKELLIEQAKQVVKESDKDEEPEEPEEVEEPEEAEEAEEAEEVEEAEEESESDETVAEEGYKIIEGSGSLKGGSFTVIRG